MSRDQKPGKVRHVGATQDRRHADAAAQPNAGDGAADEGAAPGNAAGAAATAAAGAAPAPAARGGIGMIAILLFLVFAGVGGGGIVALAPDLGLWP